MPRLTALQLAERLLNRCQELIEQLHIDVEANEGRQQLVEMALQELAMDGGAPFSDALPHIIEQVEVAQEKGRSEGAMQVLRPITMELRKAIAEIREDYDS